MRARWPSASELVDLAFEAGSLEEFRAAVLRLLMLPVGADMAIFGDFDSSPRPEYLVGMTVDEVEGARREVLRSPADLRRLLRTLALRGVARDRALYSNAEWERVRLFREFHKPFGFTSVMIGLIAAPRTRARSQISLIRAGSQGFEASDEAQFKGILRTIALGDASLRRRGERLRPRDDIRLARPAGLTPRQEELCMHLASGLTNIEIAHALRVSPHTIRNHLVNLY